ncbi:MAG TPA: O-antigen ligase family protein [Gemmatimonadales bacterium]|nr:O-antigen ligase family protein [Gemmatimonadales bacterium]
MTSIAYAALWLFVFVLPWEGVIRIGGTAIASRATGVLAIGCTMFAVLLSGRIRRLGMLHISALLFVLSAGIELFVYHAGDRLPNKYFTFVQLLLVLWMIWQLCPTRQRINNLFLAFVAGCYVSSFLTMLLLRSSGGNLNRYAAGGVDPNDLAMTLALALPCAWYLASTYHRPLLIWVTRGYIPVGIVAIGLTGSRGGLLTSVLALSIVPLTMTRLSPKRMVTMMVMLFLAGGLAVAYVPEKIVERLATTSSEVEDMKAGGRIKMWKAGFEVYPQHPILGFGTSGFVRAVTPVLGSEALVAHNSFISILVEEGIIGLSLYLLMFVAVYRGVRRLPRFERRFGLVLLGTLLLAMTPLTWEDQKPVWFVLAALMGFASTRVIPATTGARPARPMPTGRPLVGGPITRRPPASVAAPPGDAGT